jgi:hypothetical protein
MAKQDCIPKKDADFLTQLKFLRDKAPAQKTVTLRGDVPAGAFPFLASGISACPPGTGKRGPTDVAARHPCQNPGGLRPVASPCLAIRQEPMVKTENGWPLFLF